MPTRENTPINEIDILESPKTKTLIDRYLIVSSLSNGKSVLDVGCGFGYGSVILKALGAKKTVGIDIDDEAITYAKKNYPFEPHINFIHSDLFNFENTEKFDLVISLEVIEHLKKTKIIDYFKRLKSWCDDDGYIIITTPNRTARKNEVLKAINHKHEYELEELIEKLSLIFNVNNIFHLYLIEGTFEKMNGVSTFWSTSEEFKEDARVMMFIIKK